MTSFPGVGSVPRRGGTDRRPHLAGAIVAEEGPQRGGRQALIDLELGFPGANILMALGHTGRPLLAPLALRTEPLPIGARAVLIAATAGMGLAVRRRRSRRGRTR